MLFSGEVVLVAGGTGGIGASVVERFLREGARVCVASRTPGGAADAGKTRFYKTDMSREEEVDRLFGSIEKEFGRIDIVCNFVGGYMGRKDVADVSLAEWNGLLTLNLTTCFLGTRRALRSMRSAAYGRIINVSAMPGLLPEAGRGPYGVSKAAVAVLTRIAGEEAKKLTGDVTVNAIAPSVVSTGANTEGARSEELARWATPAQVADLAVYLSSKAASGINGETIRLYGKVQWN